MTGAGGGRHVRVALTGKRLDRYVGALERAGAEVVRADHPTDPRVLLDRVDALVLGGGADVDPARYGQDRREETYGVEPEVDRYECALVDLAIARGAPTLAICRGLQVLNVARGGTLHQHIPADPGVGGHGRPGADGGGDEREIAVTPGTVLAEVLGETRVVGCCHHHQAVATLGHGLAVTARADDGIVEGIALAGPDAARTWLVAVQWHPEDTAARDPVQQRLFDALVTRARTRTALGFGDSG